MRPAPSRGRHPNPKRERGPDPSPKRRRGPDPSPKRQRGPDPNPKRQRGPDPSPKRQRGPDPNPKRQRGPDPNPKRQRGPDPNPKRQRGPAPNPKRQRGSAQSRARQQAVRHPVRRARDAEDASERIAAARRDAEGCQDAHVSETRKWQPWRGVARGGRASGRWGRKAAYCPPNPATRKHSPLPCRLSSIRRVPSHVVPARDCSRNTHTLFEIPLPLGRFSGSHGRPVRRPPAGNTPAVRAGLPPWCLGVFVADGPEAHAPLVPSSPGCLVASSLRAKSAIYVSRKHEHLGTLPILDPQRRYSWTLATLRGSLQESCRALPRAAAACDLITAVRTEATVDSCQATRHVACANHPVADGRAIRWRSGARRQTSFAARIDRPGGRSPRIGGRSHRTGGRFHEVTGSSAGTCPPARLVR